MANQSIAVLVVEDDPLIALTAEMLLQELGYEVVGPFMTLAESVAHATYDDVDVAMLDFNLGHGEDSVPVAECLARRGIPYFLTSGASLATIHSRLPEALVLQKPVQKDDLARLIAAQIAA